MSLKIIDSFSKNFISKDAFDALSNEAKSALRVVKEGSGEGSDFLGWYDLPNNYDKAEFERIKVAAKKIQANSEILVVIGIGGSYLGARAAIEFIKSPLYNNLKKGTPDIYFTGNNISTTALTELLQICDGKDVAILSIGTIGNVALDAIEKAKSNGVNAALYDMIFVKPIDKDILYEVGKNYSRIITVEDGTINGGLGSAVTEFMTENGFNCKIKRIGIPDEFITHGKPLELYKICNMDNNKLQYNQHSHNQQIHGLVNVEVKILENSVRNVEIHLMMEI